MWRCEVQLKVRADYLHLLCEVGEGEGVNVRLYYRNYVSTRLLY